MREARLDASEGDNDGAGQDTGDDGSSNGVMVRIRGRVRVTVEHLLFLHLERRSDSSPPGIRVRVKGKYFRYGVGLA